MLEISTGDLLPESNVTVLLWRSAVRSEALFVDSDVTLENGVSETRRGPFRVWPWEGCFSAQASLAVPGLL